MIQQSFIFLEKIKERTEKSIWKQGIKSWDDFLEAKRIKGISAIRKSYYDRQISRARSELFSNNSRYFLNLPQKERWRLYGHFKNECVFLDIETSGMGIDDDITVIGLYDGLETKSMIKGINMNYHALREELKKYKLLITFNGATFDIPFINKDILMCCQKSRILT